MIAKVKLLKRLILFLFAFSVLFLNSGAQNFEKFFPAKDLTSIGVYYYPEHWGLHPMGARLSEHG